MIGRRRDMMVHIEGIERVYLFESQDLYLCAAFY
jgi:hypothetical protein